MNHDPRIWISITIRHCILRDLENAGFFALYFSTDKERGVVLHIGTAPRLFQLFSFIQWPIVGHISQVRLHIAVEDQVSIANRVMVEQVVQL